MKASAAVLALVAIIGIVSLVGEVTVAADSSLRMRPTVSNKSQEPEVVTDPLWIGPFPNFDLEPPLAYPGFVVQTTTVLYLQRFQVGASCTEGGWTKVDVTSQIGVFWHVDDFVGANVNPGDDLQAITGSKSLWCGSRYIVVGPVCGYATLPGYGDNWDQAWRTKICTPVSIDGILDVSFEATIDSELGYDALFLEYTTNCTTGNSGWEFLDGGTNNWDGNIAPTSFGGSYSTGPVPVHVRLRFKSDLAWSDSDGLYDSHHGAVIVDNLQVEGLATEDFEGEAVNATSSNDWMAANPAGFGQHMAVYSGLTVVQQGLLADYNVSCLWAAISASTDNYSCGGFPVQAAVPKGNANGQYIHNEIWSPSIPLAGVGTNFLLGFSVYRDNPIVNLVFYDWHVRTINGAGCASAWRNNGLLYYGKGGWHSQRVKVGSLIDQSAGWMQVALGVVDMCGVWCGIKGTGACHSHAPLFDNVKVTLITNSPQWEIHDFNQFQDTFSEDGTDTGTARADMAKDILPSSNPGVLPGDSAVVRVNDPASGLATDPSTGGPAVYLYVAVDPVQPSKSGVAIQAPETRSGSPRFPVVDEVIVGTVTWTKVRMDAAFVGNTQIADMYCVDLRDDLFEPGDEVRFFYGTLSATNEESYASGSNLSFTTSSIEQAATYASEFTILPRHADGTEGNDILYVDGVDGTGAQHFFDAAFAEMSLNPDRFDVRGASSFVSNRPGTRVTSVVDQLNANYRKIIWDSGDLPEGPGDGSGMLEKANDYALINAFLSGLTVPGGVYLGGDNLAHHLNGSASASGVTFRSSYITYGLITGNHRPTFGTSPFGVGQAGGAFAGDKWFIYGGYPLLNDFDVMVPTGATASQSTYLDAISPAGDPVQSAEISKVTGNARVMLGGFSFCYLRDDEEDGTRDGSKHMYDIITWLGNNPDQPVNAKPVAVTRLEQNYPNPFNPQTTIAFSLRERARVKIDVFSVNGELVKTLLDETRAAGAHVDVRWDGRNNANQPVSSGIYFYKLTTSNFSSTKKMVLLK